jgi:hypothetical protein
MTMNIQLEKKSRVKKGVSRLTDRRTRLSLSSVYINPESSARFTLFGQFNQSSILSFNQSNYSLNSINSYSDKRSLV